MCRLLKDLAGVEADLAFWKRRLSEGSHGRFLLLSRGPSSFIRSLSAAVHRHAPQGEGSKRLSAADKIERRVSSEHSTSRSAVCQHLTKVGGISACAVMCKRLVRNQVLACSVLYSSVMKSDAPARRSSCCGRQSSTLSEQRRRSTGGRQHCTSKCGGTTEEAQTQRRTAMEPPPRRQSTSRCTALAGPAWT